MHLSEPDDETKWAERRRWKAVRLDSHRDIDGVIVTADTESGEIVMAVPDGDGHKKVTYSLACGFTIVKR
jgi:hypothetical protein